MTLKSILKSDNAPLLLLSLLNIYRFFETDYLAVKTSSICVIALILGYVFIRNKRWRYVYVGLFTALLIAVFVYTVVTNRDVNIMF